MKRNSRQPPLRFAYDTMRDNAYGLARPLGVPVEERAR